MSEGKVSFTEEAAKRIARVVRIVEATSPPRKQSAGFEGTRPRASADLPAPQYKDQYYKGVANNVGGFGRLTAHAP